MPRRPGTRNADFDVRRHELALAAARALLSPEGGPASFRALVAATGASASVLQHYFGDHQGLVLAAFAAASAAGAPYLRAMADPGDRTVDDSLRVAVADLRVGWSVGVGALQAAGLVHGLGHGTYGPAYVNTLLEPTLQAFEARLAVHQGRGELRPELDLRYGALQLVSPLILALLHQGELSGGTCRPLDLDAFAEAHVAAFLQTWADTSEDARQQAPPVIEAPPARRRR